MIRVGNKYGARKTVVDGVTFASAKEAARYAELRTLERAGIIKGLILQPRFPLAVNGSKVCTYVADFEYRDEAGTRVIEDVKGVRTDVYRIKNKLMRAVHGIDVKEV
jgi:hypothetical protein